MPNELNHAEVADRLKSVYDKSLTEAGRKTFCLYDNNTLRQAAADERRIANGELVEVVHSRWVQIDNTQEHYCDSCGVAFNIFSYCKNDFKYCPYCGAIMDEEENKTSDIEVKDIIYESLKRHMDMMKNLSNGEKSYEKYKI